MNVVAYAMMAYAATAAISLGVVAVIVLIDKVFSAPGEGSSDD